MAKAYRFWVRNGIFYVRFRSGGGWVSTGQTDPADAEAWALARLDTTGESGRVITLGQFARDFFEPHSKWLQRQSAKGRIFSPSYLYDMKSRFKNYVIPRFKDTPLQSLRPKEIEDWLLELRKAGTKEMLIPNTKNKILQILRYVLDEAVRCEIIKDNPARQVSPFIQTESKRSVFTAEEIQALFPLENPVLLDYIWQGPMWTPFFYILTLTGLRPGEVAALQWKDWHPDLHGLVIRRAVDSFTKTLKSTKTGNVRPAILTDVAEAMLMNWREISGHTGPDDLIFTLDGSPLAVFTSAKHFRSSAARAGVNLAGRTQYCLRHTFNTDMLNLLPQEIVQRLMGHSTERMTRHYRNPKEEEMIKGVQQAKQILEERLG